MRLDDDDKFVHSQFLKAVDENGQLRELLGYMMGAAKFLALLLFIAVCGNLLTGRGPVHRTEITINDDRSYETTTTNTSNTRCFLWACGTTNKVEQ